MVRNTIWFLRRFVRVGSMRCLDWGTSAAKVVGWFAVLLGPTYWMMSKLAEKASTIKTAADFTLFPYHTSLVLIFLLFFGSLSICASVRAGQGFAAWRLWDRDGFALVFVLPSVWILASLYFRQIKEFGWGFDSVFSNLHLLDTFTIVSLLVFYAWAYLPKYVNQWRQVSMSSLIQEAASQEMQEADLQKELRKQEEASKTLKEKHGVADLKPKRKTL